jgi:hypothetical protein
MLSRTGLQSAVLGHHHAAVVINGITLDETTELSFEVIIFV